MNNTSQVIDIEYARKISKDNDNIYYILDSINRRITEVASEGNYNFEFMIQDYDNMIKIIRALKEAGYYASRVFDEDRNIIYIGWNI